jgi:hypothetical protein
LGRAKLEQDPIWWLPVGLTLTAILGGLFVILRGQLDPGTIAIAGRPAGLPSFNGLLLAGVMAVIVSAIVSILISRDINRSLTGKQRPVTVNPTIGDRQANYATIATFAVLLLIGGWGWSNAVNRTNSFDVNGISGRYPAYFSTATGPGDVFRVSDALATGADFVITMPEPAPNATTNEIANQLAGQRSTDFSLYKVLSSSNTTVNGKPALVQRFAYVDSNGLTGARPTVHQGRDYIFLDNGRAVVVTLLTTPDDEATIEPVFAQFLNSLKF